MIIWWQPMMDNLSDIYYLVQLIVRQIFFYLRDLILYKFLWLAAASDDNDATNSKLRNLTSRNVIVDIIAFSVICIVLFLLVIVSSRCEKDGGQLYTTADIETVASELQGDPYCISDESLSGTNCFYACGDTAYGRGRLSKRIFSDEDFSRLRASTRKRVTNIPKKSIFGLNAVQQQSSQCTQTETFHKPPQTWLIRRTRSGQIYGKYSL